MKKRLNVVVRTLALSVIIVFVLSVIVDLAKAQTANPETTNKAEINPELLSFIEKPAFTPPQPPEKDQCLHCHITGSDERLWAPVGRWALFGTAGGIFLFGLAKSTWVLRNKRAWVPISVQLGDWLDRRYKIKEILQSIFSKPVPIWATRWWYCLGGITAFLFVVQGITGIMLAFNYQPTPENAYASIQFIENEVRFGAAVRMIHHWAANGMVLLCFAHALRVFITGAFKPPRELNWSSGVLLMLFVLGFGLTGYLLPWDQRAYWASTVGSEIAGGIPDIGTVVLIFLRGGWNITAVTLSRFYGLHVLALPVLIIVFMGAHFLMIRRQGLKKPL